ncbi:MAG: 2-C-methyl-D-erythritol 4-phosphate cytidylyltransferase [Candidatus Sumerlaeaceae bacterium]
MSADCGVVIVAGGAGARMGGGEIPKQFRPLRDVPLFLWSVEFFDQQDSVSEIVVVVPAVHLKTATQLLSQRTFAHNVHCVTGGRRRQDSVLAGVSALSADSEYVAIHDGARPFPPPNFEEALEFARVDGAAIFALPVTDSIKRAECGAVRETVPRDELWAAQTPQIFRKPLLVEALERCDADKVDVSDDASALEHLGRTVRIVEGSRSNLKLTLPDDWLVAGALAVDHEVLGK